MVCSERGIMRLDAGPDAIAATLLPGRTRRSCSALLQRDGNRIIHVGRSNKPVLQRVEQFVDLWTNSERRAVTCWYSAS